MPIVSFLSDFGLRDTYVGTVKAVMLGICPDLTVVDLSHEVAPQNVAEAAFLARQSWPYFPRGSVHLVVVDPGVGTERAAVALRTPKGYVVGPDNGVLSAALPAQNDAEQHESAQQAPYGTRLPPGFEARRIASADVIRRDPSATFHGRDVFGPAAAALAAGFPFERIGEPRDGLFALPTLRASASRGVVGGFVVHIDHFGNLITSIRRQDLPPRAVAVEILGRRAPLVRTYGEAEGLVALAGSSGYVEVALVNGNAAAALRVQAAQHVEVRVA